MRNDAAARERAALAPLFAAKVPLHLQCAEVG